MTDEQLNRIYCAEKGTLGLRAVAAAAFEEGVIKAYRDLQPKIDAARAEALEDVCKFIEGEYPLTRKPLQAAIRALKSASGGEDQRESAGNTLGQATSQAETDDALKGSAESVNVASSARTPIQVGGRTPNISYRGGDQPAGQSDSHPERSPFAQIDKAKAAMEQWHDYPDHPAFDMSPTHWMPLPAAPAQAGKPTEGRAE